MKISATKCLGRYELKLPEPWFDEGCRDFLIKGNRLKRSGYGIQTKGM
jgi:hypothetical protein